MYHQPRSKVESLIFVICMVVGLIALCFVIAPFVGCGGPQTKPSICDGITDSLICDRIPNPQVTDVLLQLGNLELIKGGVYSKEEALEFLGDVEQFLTQCETYGGLVRFVAARLKTVPPELILLSQAMLQFEDAIIPITSTDRSFLLAHIKHQRAVVELIQ